MKQLRILVLGLAFLGVAALFMGCEGSMKEVAVLETDMGDITLGFISEKAPGHVENFKKLVREGFYDGTKFHRVIPGFMIQGGCPNTKTENEALYGTGDPGYKIPAEFNDTKHVRGILSMARGQAPNSAGSQFFICVADAPHLDNQYTAFGFVVDGLDTVDKIVSVKTKRGGDGAMSSPVEPVHLRRAYLKEIPADQVLPESD